MSAIDLIRDERQRQINEEGYHPSDDRRFTDGELARAASVYAMPEAFRPLRPVPRSVGSLRWAPMWWPWHPETFNPAPDDRVRELVKAGALIAAEIDRLTGGCGS